MSFLRPLFSLLLAASQVVAGERFLVRAWQSEDGLPGNVVRSVVQAADGWLWVATAEGVVRFDGLRFSGLGPAAETLLARRRPRALFALDDGSVWITTSRGGLLRWQAGRLAELLPEAEPEVPPGRIASVTALVGEGPGRVLLARGAETFRIEGGRLVPVERTAEIEARLAAGEPGEPAQEGVRLRDRQRRRWVADAGGLSVTDASGVAWPVALPQVEPANRIVALAEDREGSVWAATGESGLLQIRERRVLLLTSEDGLSDRTAFVVRQDHTGAWWIGSKRGGLDRLTGSAVTHFPVGDGSPNRPVSALHEDRAGTLWAATRNGSVFRLVDGAFRPAFPAPVPTSKVAALAEDASGGLWLGGALGLGCWDGAAYHAAEARGYRGGEVTALAPGPGGVLYAGTSSGALWRGGPEGFALLGEAAPGYAISALLPLGESLWIATHGAGLVRWRAGGFSRFGAAEGLPDLRLTSVLADGAGQLWLGSLGGIFRVRVAELESGGPVHWLRLDRSDGLLSRECTGGFQPAAWRGMDGELWFPTVQGVARIAPERFALNQVPPPVAIEEARANGIPLDLARPVPELGPGRTRLELRWTALTFAAPEKATFHHQLEGLDEGWREAGPARTASYEAVPPGRYRFRVRAANADGVWNEEGAALAFVVRPHFWDTAPFRTALAVLGVLAASGLGWSLARRRLRRRLAALELQHAREAERTRIARDLHDDLGASLTEISMLAGMAAEESAATGARGCLEEIAAKTQAAVGTLDEIVWAVNPRHDTLASLADYVAAFAGEFLGAAGLALRLDVARPLPALPLAADRRHSLFLALREALNNVVKHARATEVRLRLRAGEGRIVVEIEDDGCGFDLAAARGGEGLGNLQARLAEAGGFCQIESAPGRGTSVRLTV
jgi:signal transduction histidine kinase/ligand-binding sensor domain-containing protein